MAEDIVDKNPRINSLNNFYLLKTAHFIFDASVHLHFCILQYIFTELSSSGGYHGAPRHVNPPATRKRLTDHLLNMTPRTPHTLQAYNGLLLLNVWGGEGDNSNRSPCLSLCSYVYAPERPFMHLTG